MSLTETAKEIVLDALSPDWRDKFFEVDFPFIVSDPDRALDFFKPSDDQVTGILKEAGYFEQF